VEQVANFVGQVANLRPIVNRPSGSAAKISGRPSAKRTVTAQAVTLFDLVPSGEAPLAETALGAFYLSTQGGAVDLFDFVEEAFHAVVGMNQVGEGLTQVAFVGLGEFTQYTIGILVNFDLPYHAASLS
jgi:hypothetical protein